MNFSPATSERITAIVSTLVAVAILAGGVTAFQSHTAPVDDIVQLESDLRFQLEVAFRHDPNDRAARLAQLEQVTAAWRQSPRSSADREKLANWLLAATIRSMPGSLDELPTFPEFSQERPQPIVEQTTDMVVELALEEEYSETPSAVPSPAPLVSTNFPTLEADPFTTPDLETETLANPAAIDSSATFSTRSHPTATHSTTQLPTTSFPTSTIATPVRINLTELAARITGYHVGLNEVEAELIKLTVHDFAGMNALLNQLDELSHDYRFVQLYYEALTPRERRAVTAPRPLTAMLDQLERRLERSKATGSGDFLDEFDADNQNRIGALHKRIDEIDARLDR